MTCKKPHFKVQGRALGLPIGPTRMEKLYNDKRFWDSLELVEDFLQSDADGSHVGRLAQHNNCLKIAAGTLCVMHALCVGSIMFWVVTEVAAVAHVVSFVGSGVVFTLYLFCVSCCTDHQDLGLSVVYLSNAEPRCFQLVLDYGVKNAQSATKAAP